MPHLKESIRNLLRLQATLPRSLSDEISIRNPELVSLHDQFVDMASEFRLWSFYETHESSLSGSAAGLPSEVQFGAPLVSVKSALLEVWQEDVYAVDSDHAHLASFGPSSAGILDSYLADMTKAIYKAARLSLAHTHTPLHLKSHVNVEVVGFYEDPDAVTGSPRPYQQASAEPGSVIRLYSTKHPFKDFLRKGPDRCLTERLHRRRPSHGGVGGSAEAGPSDGEPAREDTGLGFFGPPAELSQSTTGSLSPEIVITSPLERPPLLRVPAQSEPAVRPSSPESTASVSTTMSDTALPFRGGFGGEGSHTIDLLAKQQARILIKEHDLTGTAGFSRPNPSMRKFTWVHMPFNNPVWVKVRHPARSTSPSLRVSQLLTAWARKSSPPWQGPKDWISRGSSTMTTGCPSKSRTAIRNRSRHTLKQCANICLPQTAWLRRGSRRRCLAPPTWASRQTVSTSTSPIFTSTPITA